MQPRSLSVAFPSGSVLKQQLAETQRYRRSGLASELLLDHGQLGSNCNWTVSRLTGQLPDQLSGYGVNQDIGLLPGAFFAIGLDCRQSAN